MVNQREQDLAQLKAALESTEMESKRLGEQAGTAKLSLQLEIDRLKRDLERIEDELRRARKELEDREDRNRERDALVDKLHAENRDLSTQLAMQTQARLNISEKLDVALASAKLTEGEAGALKSRVAELEGRLVKDQRSLLNAENLYRDQLTERNTLLLTIYQYMDKILGVDKTPVSICLLSLFKVSPVAIANTRRLLLLLRRSQVRPKPSPSPTLPSSTTTSSPVSNSFPRSNSTSTRGAKMSKHGTWRG